MFLSRPRFLAPALVLALAACSTRVVYLPAPTDTPAPAAQPAPPPPVEQYYEPLEVTVGRPVRDRFVVQTNRPAYVAIFEVIPEEGVTIVRPVSSGESYVVAGLSSVRVPWSATVLSRVSSYNGPRYLYAVASDEPLNIRDETFQPGYLRYTLGSRVYRSSDPYEVMRALSRHFVARGIAEEEWAEDVVVARPEVTAPRIAYVYCPGGTRYEVPVDMADRVRCARPDRVGRNDPPRAGHGNGRGGSAAPDSVIGDDRRRVRPRVPTQVGRTPIDRVREPVVAENNGRGPVGKGGEPVADDNGRGRGNSGNGNASNGSNGRGNDRGNNGNAYGHENGNNGNAYGHANGNNGNAGSNNGNAGSNNGNGSRGNSGGNGGNAGNAGNNGNGNGNGIGRGSSAGGNGNDGNNGNGNGRGGSEQAPSQPVVIPASARDSLRADAPVQKPVRLPQRVTRPGSGIQARPQLPEQAERTPARPIREEPAPRVEPEQPRNDPPRAEQPKREEPPRAEPQRVEPPRAEPAREEPRREEPREEARPERRPEPKAESRPEPRDEPRAKDEEKAKEEQKPEAKEEAKPESRPAKPAGDSTAARLKERMKGRVRP